MDAKKKLVELANDVLQYLPYGEIQIDTAEQIADRMIDHGVTVQDGKTLEAFLHPIDAYKGLKAKYLVFKADTGEMVENCFVLRPDKDPAAVEALRAYANATDNKTLAEDIYSWVGKGEPAQEWIPVTERLPENYKAVLTCDERKIIHIMAHHRDFKAPFGIVKGNFMGYAPITHWMPLPQPPKGEEKDGR